MSGCNHDLKYFPMSATIPSVCSARIVEDGFDVAPMCARAVRGTASGPFSCYIAPLIKAVPLPKISIPFLAVSYRNSCNRMRTLYPMSSDPQCCIFVECQRAALIGEPTVIRVSLRRTIEDTVRYLVSLELYSCTLSDLQWC